jgi:uncharacterized repeat protein (TIGR04076 family)
MEMKLHHVECVVKEIKGQCPLGYKPGDRFVIEGYWLDPEQSGPVCIHALTSMLTLLSPFLHGASAVDLGIGKEPDVGYLTCPDPGPPHTGGGCVLFELRRGPLTKKVE